MKIPCPTKYGGTAFPFPARFCKQYILAPTNIFCMSLCNANKKGGTCVSPFSIKSLFCASLCQPSRFNVSNIRPPDLVPSELDKALHQGLAPEQKLPQILCDQHQHILEHRARPKQSLREPQECSLPFLSRLITSPGFSITDAMLQRLPFSMTWPWLMV